MSRERSGLNRGEPTQAPLSVSSTGTINIRHSVLDIITREAKILTVTSSKLTKLLVFEVHMKENALSYAAVDEPKPGGVVEVSHPQQRLGAGPLQLPYACVLFRGREDDLLNIRGLWWWGHFSGHNNYAILKNYDIDRALNNSYIDKWRDNLDAKSSYLAFASKLLSPVKMLHKFLTSARSAKPNICLWLETTGKVNRYMIKKFKLSIGIRPLRSIITIYNHKNRKAITISLGYEYISC